MLINLYLDIKLSQGHEKFDTLFAAGIPVPIIYFSKSKNHPSPSTYSSPSHGIDVWPGSLGLPTGDETEFYPTKQV
jgi:hypothetical protein